VPSNKAGDSKRSFRLHNRSSRTSGLADIGREVVPGGQDQARREGSRLRHHQRHQQQGRQRYSIAADHLNNVRVEPTGGPPAVPRRQGADSVRPLRRAERAHH
ncbi:unnamed protein product, partial [Musa textilis]